jgi:transposase
VIPMLHRIPAERARGRAWPARPRSAGPPRPATIYDPYKLEILRKADACTRPGELGALLRREGLDSSHLVTWRRQRAQGLTPKTRGRKKTVVDPRVKKLEQEHRRLTARLEKAEAIIAFQKKVAELLGIPLKPFEPDEIE